MTMFHRDALTGDIHIIYQFTYANTAARMAAVLPSTDVGKVARQSDNQSYWILQNEIGPLWLPIGGGGGGGGSLQWVDGASAPSYSNEYGGTVAEFDTLAASGGQNLLTKIRVSTSYIVSNPIKLKLPFYSNDVAGNVLMQVVSTLIRSVDQVSSTANQRTSTNTALTMSGATQLKEQSVVYDLTDASGMINGVAVNPGDIILVNLSRAADTATGLALNDIYASEVTLS